MRHTQGIFPALLTPFANDRIDEQALRKLVEININKGVSGFYVCGSTGEAFLLSVEERMRVLEIVSNQVAGRVSIIAHIGAIGTDLTLELGRHAVTLQGVEALSSIPPFYYKFSEDEVVQYYLDLADKLDFPLIPYNFPNLSGVTLTPKVLQRLRKNEQIIGVKFTSNNFYDLERMKQSDPKLLIYNGFDEMYLSGLAMGVDGAIGSTFNFMADKFLGITRHFAEGDMENARKLQSEANAVIAALLKTKCFMAAEKYILDCVGIPFGEPRRPFLPLDAEDKKIISQAAESYLQILR
ncbi:N-acetylneuraminate lyase [Marispirochaeta sp.]|uniref:N-acetylneuraminate lyase n=1 Tax=Marispirochaeta sp. TaxID=2038653 RepID=UPI0029C722B7|nr:N-acetylneuraminate lyase [Marispirochaeta sp.]